MPSKQKKNGIRQGERIKSKRKELLLTQTAIADFIGVTPPTIGQWERSETSPNGENIVKLAEILQVSPEWIISGISSFSRPLSNSSKHESIRFIPLLAMQDLTPKFDPGELAMHATEFRLCTGIDSADAFALKVNGDAMQNPHGGPSMPAGTILIVDPDKEPTDKSFAVVVSKKNGALFRQYVYDGRFRWLRALNPEYTRLELFKQDLILGTVVKTEVDLA